MNVNTHYNVKCVTRMIFNTSVLPNTRKMHLLANLFTSD